MADNPPFPGRAYRQWITWMYKENRLVNGTLRLRGRRVDLRKIDQNALVITAGADHIAPRPGTLPLLDLVSQRGRDASRPPGRPHRPDGRLEGAQGDLAGHRRVARKPLRGMRPFVINGHGRLVFPSNFSADLDFSVLETLEQLEAVVKRDFEAKAPTGTEILERVESGGYDSRAPLLRDLAMNLVWGNRYAMTMYEKRPTRWRDLPRHRDDVFLPLLTPWEQGERKVAAVEEAWAELPATWDAEAEDGIFSSLFGIFRHKRHHAAELPPVKPTVAEITSDPANLTFCLPDHDPDYPTHSYQEILDCNESVAELEPLHRLAMVLHNQYPWDLAQSRLEEVGKIGDDDFVVAFVPRSHEVLEFIRRVKAERPRPPAAGTARRGARTDRAAPSPRSSASSSRTCPASSRWRSSRASTSARTRTSSATRPTAGRR